MRKWLPSVFLMLVIFITSSVPGNVITSAGLGSEPLHISVHSLLFFLLCFTNYKATKNILLSIVLTIAYGASDEYHQKFTPLRSSSMFDIYTDTAGAIISGIILWKLQPYLPKKLKNWLNK